MNPTLQQHIDAARKSLQAKQGRVFIEEEAAPTPPSSSSYGLSDAPAQAKTPSNDVRRVSWRTSYATPQKPAETIQSLSDRLTAVIKPDLRPNAYKIYQMLHRLALEVARTRGYAAAVSQVSFMLPEELLVFELGIKSRSGSYRSLQELLELGLIDKRGHKTTHNGKTVCDGTVWSVKLHPKQGKTPRLAYDDLKAKYRDLSSDIDAGRTVHAYKQKMRQSRERLKTYEEKVAQLLSWALTPTHINPSLSMTVSFSTSGVLEGVFDLPHVPRENRAELVDRIARGMAATLGDDSLNFYRWLLWQCLRLADREQDYLTAVYEAIKRVAADYAEGKVRKPGALLVTKLREMGVYDEIKRTPAYRVGAPLTA